MIKFDRPSSPSCLSDKNKDGVENYVRWSKKWCSKIKKNPTSDSFSWHEYKGKRVNEILIEALRIASDSHCAFCDKHAPENDSDSIEHFFPKKKYCDLAFRWMNLFLCCTGCQKRPKNWKQYKDKHHLILKPDEEDYSFDRYFIFNTANGNIDINLWNDSDIDKKRAEITIIYFQLNEFKRPAVRLQNFKRFYDSKEANKIKKDFGLTANELPYRFIYY